MDTRDVPIRTVEDRPTRGNTSVSDDFHYFLVAYQTIISRFLFMWLWCPSNTPFVEWRCLVENVHRDMIVDHVAESAPWDDHFIQYAQLPALRHLHTRWFAQLGFGEPEDLSRCARVFLQFCGRHGYAVPNRTREKARYYEQHRHAVHYLSLWRGNSSQRLLGRCVDRAGWPARHGEIPNWPWNFPA